ncbi:MAG: T9SS type A sorting domain-containing protein [Flavipsychrobacter sp.]|nr:T9SS type A sorting domain-containing protein [Flavipsychrobacter sp.]
MNCRFLQSLKNALLTIVTMLSVFSANAQIDYQIGFGTTNGGSTGVPTPFEDFYDGDRQQFLFRASELIAAGMGPGLITAIKWNVVATNGQGPIPGYTVTMGTTTLNDLTAGWVSGINYPVYTAGTGNYTTTVGTNAFTLPTPFTWNGTDNIVVQVCHGTAARPCYTYTYCASVNWISTSWASSAYYRQDCSGSLCATPTGYALYNRPNTIFTYGQPCTGTPTGYSVDAPYEVCPNKVFKVALAGPYLSNLAYEWEYSNNGSAWQPYTGPLQLNGSFNDAIIAPRWYRCKITCTNSSQSMMTAPFKVSIAPFYLCYCDNGVTATAGLDIGNVKVIKYTTTDPGVLEDTVLNNGNASPSLSNNTANKSYTNFQFPPNKTVKMYRDSSYRFLVSQINSTATFKNGNVAIFIDLDRNGLFDAGEKLMNKTIDGADIIPNTESVTFKIPTAAAIGLTGMRVILSNAKIDSCGTTMAEGEVEDYLVDMRYEPCKGPGNAGSLISTSTSLCAGYDYITGNIGYEMTKSDLTRFWQVSGDNVGWTNINGSTGKDTLMRVFTGQPLYYRVRMICEATKDTTYSAPLKINAKDGYKCYCYSQAIGGNPKDNPDPRDSSDIGGVVFSTFNTNTGGAHLQNINAQEKRTDHTDDNPLVLFTDSTYTLTVYHTQRTSIHADAKITVFMDFNNNKEFDLPYERLFTGFSSIGNFTVVENITIPYKVITDVPTGMRIILNNDLSPNIPSDEACGPYTSGETEDIIVKFIRPFPASVSNVGSIDNFGLYPNPTNGKFRLQFNNSNALGDVTMTITNVTGQQVMLETLKHNGGTFTKEVDMTNSARGVYFVELRSADGLKAVQRVVID